MSRLSVGRWGQLLIGILCMAMIANLQYGWTLFVNPIEHKFHWSRASIQIAFTIFVLTETWLVPIEGYLVERFGPRPVMLGGGLLVGLSWMMNSVADSLGVLYVAAALGGIGAGAVYGTCVGNALKWFPERRGLAAGLTAMGFGAGSSLSILPIAWLIKSAGYQSSFLYIGTAQGILLLVLGWFLRKPPYASDEPSGLGPPIPSPHAGPPAPQFTPRQMLMTPVFWVMYCMFVMMAAGGLIATAQLGPIATDFRIADVPVSFIGLTLPALPFALSLDRVLNGITRPFFGWVSDQIGRENTMFLAFGLEGFGIILLGQFGHDPVAFVMLTGLVFFAWGEIYSLFPATCGDTFGSRHAATNAGLLYTAKGMAAILVPLASVIAGTAGWGAVFRAAAILNFSAAVMALVILKPLRARIQNRRLDAAIVVAALD